MARIRNEENAIYRASVFLNVYDLDYSFNRYSHWFGFGFYHSGIQVYGREYSFAPHSYPSSGVYELAPRGADLVYRGSIQLGYTNMPRSDIRIFMGSVSSEYHGNTYHLLKKNCNHFTDDMARRLTGKGIPRWINRLAQVCKICCFFLPQRLEAPDIPRFVMPDGSIGLPPAPPQMRNESEDTDPNNMAPVAFPAADADPNNMAPVALPAPEIDVGDETTEEQ